MTVNAEMMPSIVVFKSGTLDGDALNDFKPGVEIYTKHRPTCFDALQGAAQQEDAR